MKLNTRIKKPKGGDTRKDLEEIVDSLNQLIAEIERTGLSRSEAEDIVQRRINQNKG